MSEANELPNGWATARLQEVTRQITDGSHLPPPKQDVGLPMLSAVNINNNSIDLNGRLISEQSFEVEHKRTNICSGDVLLTIVGTIGRSAVVLDALPRFTVQRSVAVIKPLFLDSKFLNYQFQSQYFQSQLSRDARGTAQKGVYLKSLRNLDVLIAPSNEQDRIVAKIEELFSDLDAGVAALKRAKANLKRYRAAVLKAAVEGKLTAEWRAKHPKTEPASKLLERILIERRKKWEADQLAKFSEAGREPPKNWKAKYVEPSPPDTTDLPELPQGWCWATLSQVAFFQNGQSFPSSEYCDEGAKLLRPGNLFDDGTVKWTEKNTKHMPATWKDRFPHHVVRGGELVMNLTAQSLKDEFLGRICMTAEDEFCLLNQRIARIVVVKGVLTKFVLYLLKSSLFRRFVNGLNTGSLIQHMFTSQLDGFRFPLPPIAEQEEVVAAIEEHLDSRESADRTASASLLRVSSLRQSILKQAFEGKLVPQDPKDESASELLKRIKASPSDEMPAASKKKRTKQKAS